MDGPSELSLAEIRAYMLRNNCRVTNHSLVKHFKRFLTNPDSQNEARKQFKTYVNILATIKNENNQKYLILRDKYLYECPPEELAYRFDCPMSPGAVSVMSEGSNSPARRPPPPYKPPPEVSPSATKIPVLQDETKDHYRDCINEFQSAINILDSNRGHIVDSSDIPREPSPPPDVPPRKRSSVNRSVSGEKFCDENKENVSAPAAPTDMLPSKGSDPSDKNLSDSENQVSVKEVTKKFNRMASEEEAKVIISPSSKKKPEVIVNDEKISSEEKVSPEVTIAHPEARKWIVSAAKADYQELAKLASKHPELVKLQDPTTGYTALHWAAKHGNEDVVKLIAGTYKANINSRTNGGYTPLHLAVQFGKPDIFELLCNVYKANRDLTDWSGNKPLDYSKQSTSVSASTYSSEYSLPDQQLAFNHGRSSSAGGSLSLTRKKRPHQRYATTTGIVQRTQSLIYSKETTNSTNHMKLKAYKGSMRKNKTKSTPSTPIPEVSFSDTLSNMSAPIFTVGEVKEPRRKESFLRKTFRATSKSTS